MLTCKQTDLTNKHTNTHTHQTDTTENNTTLYARVVTVCQLAGIGSMYFLTMKSISCFK